MSRVPHKQGVMTQKPATCPSCGRISYVSAILVGAVRCGSCGHTFKKATS